MTLASLLGFVSRRLDACARLVGVVAVLVVLLPLSLGPAAAPLARALGVEPEHTCACGMKPGTCGCPECARRLSDEITRVPDGHDVITSCDEHRSAPLGSPVPFGLPAASVAVAAAPRLEAVSRIAAPRHVPLEASPPPTPPPRSVAV